VEGVNKEQGTRAIMTNQHKENTKAPEQQPIIQTTKQDKHTTKGRMNIIKTPTQIQAQQATSRNKDQ
jgi:hypothetical protein